MIRRVLNGAKQLAVDQMEREFHIRIKTVTHISKTIGRGTVNVLEVLSQWIRDASQGNTGLVTTRV